MPVPHMHGKKVKEPRGCVIPHNKMDVHTSVLSFTPQSQTSQGLRMMMVIGSRWGGQGTVTGLGRQA